VHVDYTSRREESFYDLQLDVKGCGHLKNSFTKYIDVETLSGENQYEAEGHGKQDAQRGMEFLAFPPVLTIHLKRFEFDPRSVTMVKINDRFEYVQMNLCVYSRVYILYVETSDRVPQLTLSRTAHTLIQRMTIPSQLVLTLLPLNNPAYASTHLFLILTSSPPLFLINRFPLTINLDEYVAKPEPTTNGHAHPPEVRPNSSSPLPSFIFSWNFPSFAPSALWNS
jgi:hypothetical protein